MALQFQSLSTFGLSGVGEPSFSKQDWWPVAPMVKKGPGGFFQDFDTFEIGLRGLQTTGEIEFI
jgi:hypothetical protein